MEIKEAEVRAFVMKTLKEDKNLTEREVKVRIGRAFKVSPTSIGARPIREVRRTLGIDRPRALAYARALLSKNPKLEAKKVIADVTERFGIRFGSPDVSRLRPRGAKERARARREAIRPERSRARRMSGAIRVVYEGNSTPEDLATFFRSLGD